uniref:N-acetyltransferase domain-containing protein n=2 Tax=Parascaris univalens TaxID=6257 RepID=A0A915AE21_PARUN
MLSSRTFKEIGIFGALIVAMHYAYYKIQMNESLVAKDQRQELFYMRWLKKKIPALKGIGIPEEDDH